jgi:hypothetical protein
MGYTVRDIFNNANICIVRVSCDRGHHWIPAKIIQAISTWIYFYMDPLNGQADRGAAVGEQQFEIS